MRHIGMEDTLYSNADEVVSFLDAHEGRRYSVGEALVLPDIGQEYRVEAVRPFTNGGRFSLYLDLSARCAVAGCETRFGCSVDTALWRGKRHLKRCCPEHRYQFTTQLPGAWRTVEEREALLEAADAAASRRRQRAERKGLSRRGVVERAVLQARAALELVEENPAELAVVGLAVRMLARPSGRDTRRQSVVRAVTSLRRRGLL